MMIVMRSFFIWFDRVKLIKYIPIRSFLNSRRVLWYTTVTIQINTVVSDLESLEEKTTTLRIWCSLAFDAKMSRGVTFDPLHATKTSAYADGKPKGPYLGTIFGTPDFKYIEEKLIASVKVGGAVGLTYGIFGTILKDEAAFKFSRDRFAYFGWQAGQNLAKGALIGAMYFLTVTGASKLRGDTDDALNHFFGGFGISAVRLLRNDWHFFVFGGTAIGVVSAVMKTLYMNDFQQVLRNKEPHNISYCRYPEMYVMSARPYKGD